MTFGHIPSAAFPFLLAVLLLSEPLHCQTTATSLSDDASCKVERGITVALLGDSITWLGGDDCKGEKGWSRYFVEEMGEKVSLCRSYARSGATWTNTPSTVRDTKSVSGRLDNNNVIYNQVCRLVDDVKIGSMATPDVIMIAAGINDIWFLRSRPQALSRTPEEAFAFSGTSFITGSAPGEILSLAWAVRYNCELLMEAFPDAQIVLLTPSQCTKVPYATLTQACDIIEGCARRMALGVIRLDRCSSVYSIREGISAHSTYDGVHTSSEGARRNGVLIANALRSMLQK